MQRSVKVGAECCRGCVRGRRQRTHDRAAVGRQQGQPVGQLSAKLSADAVAHDAASYCLTHDQADQGLPAADRASVMHDEASTARPRAIAYDDREVRGAVHTVARRHHENGSRSGGELAATLAAAAGDDGPAGPSAHAQPEAVRLGAAAVVRLIGALAHDGLRNRIATPNSRLRRAEISVHGTDGAPSRSTWGASLRSSGPSCPPDTPSRATTRRPTCDGARGAVRFAHRHASTPETVRSSSARTGCLLLSTVCGHRCGFR